MKDGAFAMKILVADGHPTMRLGLKGLLLATEARVVGESGSGEETVKLAEETRPDLVVLGLNLVEEMDGVETCRRLKEFPEPPRVLVHTSQNLPEAVYSCLFAEADAFLHKSAGCERLLEAMRRAARGERVWLSGERVGKPRSHLLTTPGVARLTHREREVLVLMLRRHTDADIAKALVVSTDTVKSHTRSVLRKLGFKGRGELFRPRQAVPT
jgi:DNA-binding NarL/FixJ family response regulator